MTAAAALCPETQLAQSLAELAESTQLTLANLRTLRRIFCPPPRLQRCTHETHVRYGGTGEWDESFQCLADATLTNLHDDTQYCLAHHLQHEKENETERTAPRAVHRAEAESIAA